MSTKIRVIALRMGEAPKVEEIDGDLAGMQAFVGGSVECVGLESNGRIGADLWCNEEGLFTCKPNRHVMLDWGYSQVIYGPMFIAAVTPSGRTASLTDKQVEKWLAESAKWPRALSSLKDGEAPAEGELLLIM